jgi:hypothetical protein
VTNVQKGALVVVTILVLIMGYVLVQPGDDDGSASVTTTAPVQAQPAPTETTPAETTPPEITPAEPEPSEIEVEGGKPVGGIQKIKVDKGDQVDIVVKSDQGGEIHLHGYDIAKEIPDGGGQVEFKFEAANDGIYEIEVEATGTQIGELTVEP